MTQPRFSTTAAIISLILLTLLFFWKILLTNLILIGVDSFLYFYPYKAYAAEALRQGRLPLWNPHLFMGVPLLANSQVGVFYPLNWPLIWLDAPRQVAWSIGLHIALAGLSMWLLARQALHLSGAAAFVAAILFAFGGYLGAQVEHINQLNAAAWLPLLFLLYEFGRQQRQGRRWFWFLWLALVVGLILLAGHAQTVFISLFGLGLYALWLALADYWKQLSFYREPTLSIRGTRLALVQALFSFRLIRELWRQVGPLAVVSLIAGSLAAVQLLPTAELSALSIRSEGLTLREVLSFSLPPTTLHFTLLPPFGLDLSQVWGQAFGEWVAYVGISGLLLALLGGLAAWWRASARPFVWLTLSGLILSLGIYSGPVYALLYYLGPGFSLFRVPARWLLLYAFGVALLAGLGFDSLAEPALLRQHVFRLWCWLRTRPWPWLIFLALPVLVFLLLLLWRTPPLLTLSAWLGLSLISLILLSLILRPWPSAPPLTWLGLQTCVRCVSYLLQRRQDAKIFNLIFPLRLGELCERLSFWLWLGHVMFYVLRFSYMFLLIAELFWAAQSLNYNQPTAPQAYHSLRNAVAFLLAADPPAQAPPDRFLSLSGITYDPGDLPELEQIFGGRLSPRGLDELVVATKEKEVLAYNLPLLYGLHSVDGYDGGILPLSQFITLQKLFLPADDLSLDGRLREKLRFVPPGRLLSLLNTRWIITDKMFDAWIDGIFYDLQFPARLEPGQSISTRQIPEFPATALGVVSHLIGAADVPDGTPVALVRLSFVNGRSEVFTLRAGLDTAEGAYPAHAAHVQAKIGLAWPYGAAGVDYVTLLPLAERGQVVGISLEALLPAGQVVIKGITLVHEPTNTSRSVILSTEGLYRQVHSGDVKIYENLAVLPRAFVVHQAEVVTDEQQALTTLRSPEFDPARRLVRFRQGDEALGVVEMGQASVSDRAEIVSYKPERVEIVVFLETPGWLVLSDTSYPGWQATVDDQSTQIVPANLMFRAVPLPAGEHTVRFEFRPRSLQIGGWLSGLALVGLLAGLGFTGRSGR